MGGQLCRAWGAMYRHSFQMDAPRTEKPGAWQRGPWARWPARRSWMTAKPTKSRDQLGHEHDAQQALFLLLSSSPALEQLGIYIRKPRWATVSGAGMTGVGLGVRWT